MSSTIDQRVVEMRFDNSHFEKNVSTTMSTLEKLKSKLNLSGASRGLNDINTAAKGFGRTGFAGAVDTVTARFSALQVMGVTALANITNSAVNAGKSIVKSLTIDPIKSGFSEYETKMGSIQTILANTEHQGTKMADVTAALDELNLYADKTIYNFQEMTRNIGTFTAAGVDLETSVKSIQGIANLAAVSGSTSQQASTAMYQLSQALATGTVKLMDWNSVVNAGMGGKVFQNALIQTAAMLDGSAKDVEAWQAKNIDAFGSFRDSLTQGEWLTGEVLTRTLQQFTMAAEVGSETWQKYKEELMDTGYTEEQAEGILKMANTATDAATKVKTFTQLMDTLKESAQSGWAQTWETLIGNFEEAKEFFTGLSDLFGGIIGDSANRRNNFLTEVFSSNWNKLTTQINKAGIETEKFEESIENLVGKEKFKGLIDEYGSLEKAAREGAISSDILKKALDGISGTSANTKIEGFVKGLKEITSTLRRGDTGEEVKKLQTALDALGYDLGKPGIDGIIGPITDKAIKAFQEANGIIADGVVGPETLEALEKAGTKVEEVSGNVKDLKGECDSLIDVITETSGRELLLNSLMNVIKAIARPLQAIGEAFRNTFSIAPEKLYGALEKIESFTSKFVPKGILDETKWSGLIKSIEKVGVSGSEFVGKLKETLESHGVNVDKLVERYGSLAKAFEDGAISFDHIKETLLSFEGITESLLLGGETADKVRRTFEGLFAIFDIIATLTGGALKVGFEIITELLGRFDLDILDVTANIGDAIVGFRDFIDSMLNVSGVVDFLMPYVEKLVQAIGDFVDAVKDSGVLLQFAEYIGKVSTGLVDLALAIPGLDSFKNLIQVLRDCGNAFVEWCAALKESENIPGDIISGLVSGLAGGAGAVIGAAIQLGLDIIAGICSALGIASPSTEMITVGEYAIEGLVIGLKNGISGLLGAIKAIGLKIVEWFKNIDFGAIFSIAVAAGLVWVVKMVGDALKILAVPFEGFGQMLEDLGDMFEGIGSKFKAEAWESRANAIRTFAIAVAILAAAVWGLAQIEDHGKLWSAVTAIGSLAIIIGAVAVAVNMLTSSPGFKSLTSGIKLGGLGTALLGLSVALIAMAFVVKQIGDLDPAQAEQAFNGLIKMFAAIAGLVATFGIFVRGDHSKNISKVGGMMTKLAFALLLMVGVVKLASKLTPDELTTGGSFVTAFMIFTAALAAIGAIPGKGIEGIGSMMLKISVALLLMIGVVKLAGQLSNENGELYKAAAFAGAFLAFVAILKLIGMIPGTDISKLGSTLMGMSTAMLILVAVAKLIATMEWGDMGKAAVGILGLVGIIALLTLVVKMMGSDAPKLAGTLLALSVAMGILAGIAILMSLMSVEGLTKGLIAVTVLGGIMAAMIWAARGVKGCVGELVVMTVAVGLLAGVVAALSLIEPGKLVAPTLAMTVLMGMFTLLMKSTNNVKGSMGTLIAMVGAVAVLAGLVYLLAGLPVESVIGSAASLSVLLLSLTVSLKILSTIKSMSMGAFAAMGILLLIVAGIAAILGVLTALDCAPSIETALSISTLLLAMSAVYAVLGLTGGLAGTAMSGALGMMGVIAIIGGIALAIGALMSLIPSDKLSEWKQGLEDFMDFISILATGLGEAIGGLVGGVLEGVSGGIETFSGSIGKLTEALGPFADAAKKLDGDVMAGVTNLVDLVTAITGNSFVEKLTNLGGGSSMDTFAAQLKSFGTAMKDYATAVTGVDVGVISASATAAQDLVAIAQGIPSDGLLGLDGIDDFGRNVKSFGTALKDYSTEVDGLNCSAIQSSVGAAKWLIEIAGMIPSDGFLGLDGIDDFGNNIKTFGTGIKSYAEQVSGIDTTSVSASVTAAQDLVAIAQTIPDDGFLGLNGIDDFGNNIKSFGGSIKGYSEEVSGLDNASVTNSITAAGAIQDFITGLAGFDSSGIDAFKQAVKDLSKVNLDGVAEAFTNTVSSLKAIGGDMGAALAEGLKSKLSQTKANAAVLVNEAASMVETRASKFKTAGEKLVENLSDGMTSKKGDISDAGETLASEAASGAEANASGMEGAGNDLGSGLVAGINAMVDAAYDAGFALGQAAVQGEKDGQASASPSKLTIKAGKWLGEGLIIGMKRMGNAVYKAGESMGKDAVGSISGSVSRISDMINSDIDAQPTIRPVLDLSNVETGMGAIGSMFGGNSIGVLANVGAVSTMMNRRSQNGANSEVVSAIDKLRKDVGNLQTNSYNIGGVSYEDGSAVSTAINDLIRAMRVEGRI